MRIFEQSLSLPVAPGHRNLLSHLKSAVSFRLGSSVLPNRFAITRTSDDHYEGEVGVIEGRPPGSDGDLDVFRFERRKSENTGQFTAALVVPTGIGAEIGGHAGDAGPVATLIATACDRLVTHPNVVNASDINEMPENCLYVEGSVLTRFLMGSVGLQPVRSNRVLVVMDAHEVPVLRNATINAVNGARAAYGFRCPKIVMLDPPLEMQSEYTSSGRAAGQILGFERLLDLLERDRAEYDAVALSSVVQVPASYHKEYFERRGEMVNPWGGVEALLTHAVSSLLDVPSAHSPMLENETIANADTGIVEPRMAAEAYSVTFLQCILKGLQRSPKIVSDTDGMQSPHALTAADVSCLVIPDGCIGLPTLAALEQGIPVIAVRENANLMKNDLAALPWASDQLHVVDNYWEAVGVMTALRAGLSPSVVRRPIQGADLETHKTVAEGEESVRNEIVN